MMKLIARLGEREELIELERHGNHFHVRVGEVDYQVDATPTGELGRSLLIDGVQHEIAISPLGRGRYEVSSARGLSEVQVLDPLTHLANRARADAGDGSLARVTAYMPGRVVAVLAEEGESVEAGQGVVVLEAMKMENEIQSEVAGRIKRILVEAGQPVENGDLLFEIE
jgi:pyruvate carboxylase subunit B